MPRGHQHHDGLRVKTVHKGKGAKGEDVLECEPVVPVQHELRIQYLTACIEALAKQAGVTLPAPPAGYIAP